MERQELSTVSQKGEKAGLNLTQSGHASFCLMDLNQWDTGLPRLELSVPYPNLNALI
jgi:hypothetical protein